MDIVDKARDSLLRFWALEEPWETLRQRVADDDDLLRVVARSPLDYISQDQTCRMFFAAMDFLSEKRRFKIPSDVSWTTFRGLKNFLLNHEEEFVALLQRPVQVNDPRRCVGLYAGLLFASSRTSHPIALVEVGPSLGLNLCMDLYAYNYLGAGRTGHRKSKCLLRAEVHDIAARGQRNRRPSFRLPKNPPRVGVRIGLELQPVSLTEDSIAWMRAFHFPKDKKRFDQAVSIRRRAPIQIIEGNAADTLIHALSLIPSDQVPLVFHTSVAYQMPESVREGFSTMLAKAAGSRRLMYMTWAEEYARRGAILQVTDFDLANGIAERNLLAFATRWDPVPKLEWVYSPPSRQ